MAVFTGNGSVGSPSFTFSSDTNTGIFRPGTDQLGLVTNGATRLFIGDTGRVGLGTSNPEEGLDLRTGNIQVKYAGVNADPDGARYLIFNNTDTTLVLGQPLGGINWVSNDTDYAGINGSIRAYVQNNTANADLRFYTGQNTQAVHINAFGDTLFGGTLPSAPNIRLNANGDVIPTRLGVGTTTPSKPVQVRGEINDSGFITSAYGSGGTGRLAPGTYVYDVSDSDLFSNTDLTGRFQLGFAYRASGTWTFKFISTQPTSVIGEIKASLNSGTVGFLALRQRVLDVVGAAEGLNRAGADSYFESTTRLSRNKGTSGGSTTQTGDITTSAGRETIDTVEYNVFTITMVNSGTNSGVSRGFAFFDLLFTCAT
jgi:hypothetical protein